MPTLDPERRPLIGRSTNINGDIDDNDIQRNLENDISIQEIPPISNSSGGTQVLYGYVPCLELKVLSLLAVVFSFGLLLLLFHWRPKTFLVCTHVRSSLENATKLLIMETYQGKCKTYQIKDVKTASIDSDEEQKFSYQNENYDASHGDGQSGRDSVTVFLEDGSSKDVTSYRFFRCKKVTFIWEENCKRFNRLVGMEKNTKCSQFHSAQGFPASQQARIRRAYGENEIVVPVQTILTLLVLEFFNPFYIFQVFTIAVWLAEDYYYYCVAIVIMSVFGITTSVIQTNKNQTNLRSTVQSVGDVLVCRDRGSGHCEEVSSSQLVPGDLIMIPARGCTMHVDAVLLDGSCIVNESMLTGESVPVTKTALPSLSRLYDIKEDSSHTLYCGTRVIQTRYYNNEPVKAVVLRTGFLTTKGELVRSIMYPLPADFKFDRDSYKFIIILSVLALLGLIYTIALKAGRNVTVGDVIIKSLDILTIVVPPALPAAMTVGRLYAISRLRKLGVFCINPRVINVCGSIACVCFDKTGTLTEDGLDMWGVVPARLSHDPTKPRQQIIYQSPKIGKTHHNNTNTSPTGTQQEMMYVTDFRGYQSDHQNNHGEFDWIFNADEQGPPDDMVLGEAVRDPSMLNDNDFLKIGMNVCHGLTILDGQLSGDPLDVKMFECTGWILEEPVVPDTTKYDLLVPTVVRSAPQFSDTNGQSVHEWGIVRQYQFNSSLQRCSVISKSLASEHYMVFCKGSPEMIVALSRPETVPVGIKSSLRRYTQQGYRVLALACRPLKSESFVKIQRMTRDQAEVDLIFLGLVVMENRLKKESAPVIAELLEADIKVVMITGDNLDTAVSVASECGLLRHGEKLVMCEAVPSEDKNAKPSLYYTSSMISVQGLKMSKTTPANVPSVKKITTSHSNIAEENSSSNADLCPPSLSASSMTVASVEAGYSGRNGTSPRNGNANANAGGVSGKAFAMTGDTWRAIVEHYPHLMARFVTAGTVFARMTSDQKQQLVVELQALGYYVAMCGDGANDCGALKAAHVGISVSGEESSVASPFTSRDGHVGCVPLVVREGRAALTTSFGMFKFMVAYSLTEFLSVAFLYYFDSNLTDFQFLFIDIALIVNFAFFFGKTEAYPGRLCRIPPNTSLLGFVPLFSMISQIVIIIAFQAISYTLLTDYSWYTVHKYSGDDDYDCYENYAIFCISMFQYIILAVVYSHGSPYRRSVITNGAFVSSLVIMTAICIYITMYPAAWVIKLLELVLPVGYQFRYVILGLGAANFVVSMLCEKFIVEYLMQAKELLPERLKEGSPKSISYQNIFKQMENDRDWPPISSAAVKQDVCGHVDEKSKNVSDVPYNNNDQISELNDTNAILAQEVASRVDVSDKITRDQKT